MQEAQKTRMQFEDIPAAMLTVLDDLKQIKNDIQEIRKGKPENTVNAHIPIGIERVSELTGKAVTTLYRYTANGLIPCYKRGKSMLFYEDEIVSWIRSGKCLNIEERAEGIDSCIVPLSTRKR